MFLGLAKLLQWIPWSLLPRGPGPGPGPGPGLPRDQVGARHSLWISAKDGALETGSRAPLDSVLVSLRTVYQILPLFWRLYYDKIPYIGLPHISITHALPSKFTWVFIQERYRQERQTKAQNPDLKMCEKPSQVSLLVLSSKDLPYGSPSGMQKPTHSIKHWAIC